MRPLFLLLLWLSSAAFALERKTATTHPIEYYVSVPDRWSAQQTWPVVFIIESANKEFEATAEAFRAARGSLPFILVTPLVLTNGGARYREAPTYHYSEAVWARVEREGRCRFDSEGLAAIAADIRRLYHGEDRYYLTGLEAAGHTIWMQVFTHPETLRAAAPVAPNFQNRCVDELGGYSSSPARAQLPLRVFAGANDEYFKPGAPFRGQTTAAQNAALAHGFGRVSESIVPAKGHELLAAEVLAYFHSLRR